MGRKARYGRVEVVSEQPLGVQEASGVASLGEGRFLVVDDEHGVFRCSVTGDAERLDAGVGLADLEGVCVTPDGAAAYLLAERDGGVWRHDIEGAELAQGTRVGRLPRLAKKKNQGWEGIAIAPAGIWGASAELVAVHQTKPRQVVICSLDTLEPRARLRLPKAARKALGDLNDVTVDPQSGHLLVLSGKPGRIAELALVAGELSLVALYRVESSAQDVPEGLTMDGQGRIWVVTDGAGLLRELRLS